jgi:hypothetical protein
MKYAKKLAPNSQNIRIPLKEKSATPPSTCNMLYLAGLRGISKVVLGFQNCGYHFLGVGEMIKGDFADAFTKNIRWC